MKIALLIIDLQPVYVEGIVPRPELERVCEYINYTAEMLRDAGHVVVQVRDIEGAEHADDAQYRMIPQIEVSDEDLHVDKVHPNAFWQTDLEQMLNDKGVDLVVAAGFAIEYCVTFTYNGALERGFRAVLLQNGFAGAHADTVAAAARDRNLISHTVIEHILAMEGGVGG